MMDSLSEGGAVSAARICRAAGVFRTTFYRHFESVDDLDDRFLHLFFSAWKPDPLFEPRSLALAARAVVECMLRQPAFFRAVYTEERLLKYRQRWREEVDARLASWFEGREGSLGTDRVFSLGAVERYLELGLSISDLDTLTRLLHSYLEARE